MNIEQYENQIICSDFRNVADSIFNVALTVTSPPYFNLRDYAHWKTYKDFLTFCKECVEALYKITVSGGWVAWNIQRTIPIPPKENNGIRIHKPFESDMIKIFEDANFLYENSIVWFKGKAGATQRMFGSYPYPNKPILTNYCETIILVRKEGKRIVSKQIKEESKYSKQFWIDCAVDLWNIRPETSKAKIHSAPFPIEIPNRLIKLYSFKNDIILDPFVGSGTTCVAAKELGRKYIGIDISKEYCESTREALTPGLETLNNLDLAEKLSSSDFDDLLV